MILKGLDEAWAKAEPQTAYDVGFRFIIGYVSQDNTGKNLTADDVARIHAANMAVAFVYEYNPSSALGGYSQGVIDGRIALAHLQSLGAPTGVACYSASTDFDVQPGQYSVCLAYETGFAGVLLAAGYRAGAYTGYSFAQYLASHNYAGFIWQTYAWSHGAWLASAALRQTKNGVSVAGSNVDIDESEVVDFGQWGVVTVTQPSDFVNALLNTPIGSPATPSLDGHTFLDWFKEIAYAVTTGGPLVDDISTVKDAVAHLQSTVDNGVAAMTADELAAIESLNANLTKWLAAIKAAGNAT